MPKSITRTVRIDEELDRAIAKRAADDGVTVNLLVNRCLRKLVEWDVPTGRLGSVSVPSVLLSAVGDYSREEQLELCGRRVAREYVKPGAEYMFGSFCLDSAVKVLRRASLYSGRMSFDLVSASDSRKSVLLLKQDQGRKWSSYWYGVMDETFRVMLGLPATLTQTDMLVIMQLDSPSFAAR